MVSRLFILPKMKKILFLILCAPLLVSCDDLLSQIGNLTPDVNETRLYNIEPTDLNGWEEGFLFNNEVFFVIAEDSILGTIAYFNKLNEDFNAGLLIKFDEEGLISRIYDHNYTYSLNFSEDSLYVISIPADTTSSNPIEYKRIAFDYKQCSKETLTRAGSSTMDKLAMYYLLHKTGVKLEISDKEIWETLGQVVLEEAIQEGLTKGITKAAGKFAGTAFGTLLLAADVITLYDEVEKYAYFGHARLNVSEYGTTFNPKDFLVEFENFKTLPSPDKYGFIQPFEYECGVLLDEEHFVGPISFKAGQMISLGKYEIPELESGYHSLVPYIICKNGGTKVIGKGLSFFIFNEKPEYEIGTKNIEYKNEKVFVELDFKWTPVVSSYIEYQGISFTKPNGEMFCLNLSDYQGGNAPHLNDTKGDYSKQDFNINYKDYTATTNLKIEYWVKFRSIFETKSFLLEDYKVVYDKKPNISLTKVKQGETLSITPDAEGRDMRTLYIYEYEISGALFVDEMFRYLINLAGFGEKGGKVPYNYENSSDGNIIHGISDGKSSNGMSFTYWSDPEKNQKSNAYIYFGINCQGREILSTNCIELSGVNRTVKLSTRQSSKKIKGQNEIDSNCIHLKDGIWKYDLLEPSHIVIP